MATFEFTLLQNYLHQSYTKWIIRDKIKIILKAVNLFSKILERQYEWRLEELAHLFKQTEGGKWILTNNL